MHRLISRMAAVVLCAAFAVADCSVASAGRRGLFHSGLHGFRGFCGGGIYPYSLLGCYPRYLHGSYYPYSFYEDDAPDCDFVWVNRTVKHKIVQVASGGACELSPIARNSENRRGIQQFEWRVISGSVTFIQPQTRPTQVVMGRLLPGT
jgi:hypothetical protein